MVLGEAIDQQIGLPDGLRADRHTVTGIEVIVEHTHVRGAALDGDVVVAIVDPAMRDGEVG